MAVTFDTSKSGYSAAPPTRLPYSISWEHTSSAVSNPQPGAEVWVVSYRAGTDIIAGSARSCTWGGVAMVANSVVALLNNSILIEQFVLVGQTTGAQPAVYTYNNINGVRPQVVRASSYSYKGVLGFGAAQSNSANNANGTLSAISATGEFVSVCNVSLSRNISATSGTDLYTKNNVSPRVVVTNETGATAVAITMTNSATDWAIVAGRVLPGASEPAPPPPTTPTLPDVEPSPLGLAMMALPNLYTVSPDIKVYPLATSAPAYASPTTFAWDTGAASFRIGGELVLSDHSSMQCGVNGVSGQDTDTNPLTAGLTSFEVEFWTIKGDFTIKFRAFANSDYLVLVDDMPVTTTWQNFGNSGYRYQRITINDDGAHRVRILNGCNGFCGVIVPGGGDVQPAGPRFQIAANGDSYLQGAGSASEPGQVMAGGICGHLSLFGFEVINLGQGTTGYIQPGTGGSRTKFGSVARLAKLADWTPDVILVFGGGNDTDETPSDVATAANAYWNAIAAAHASAKLIVCGIQSPDLFPAAQMTALNTALRVAALANANVDLWIDMREPEYWVTDVTEELFITNEFPASIHPGKAGAMNIAMRMVSHLAMQTLT